MSATEDVPAEDAELMDVAADLQWLQAQARKSHRRPAAELARLAATEGSDERQGAEERPSVLLSEEEAEVNDAVVAELERLEGTYQRGGQLVRVVEPAVGDVSTAPRIEPLPLASLREDLTKVVRFQKLDRYGEPIPARPADWCVRAVAARGTWPRVPVLRGVIEWPVLRPDGSLIQEPGYDAATKLLYMPSATFKSLSTNPLSTGGSSVV